MKKSKKESQSPSSEQPPLAEVLSENSLIQWVSQNGQSLLISAAVLIILLFVGYKFLYKDHLSSESAYLKAQASFLTFKKGTNFGRQDEAAEKGYTQLVEILKRYPELHQRYDALIAQTLLNRGEAEEALPFAKRTWERTQHDHLSLFTAFGENALTIGEANYPLALSHALELKEKLLHEAKKHPRPATFSDTLFAFNLLRIALLQQQVGTPEEEMAAWNEWAEYTKQDQLIATHHPGVETNSYATVTQQFEEGNISLKDYIQAREQGLKAKQLNH